MAFPSVKTRSSGTSPDATSRSVTLPSGITPGDLLITGISSGLGTAPPTMTWNAVDWIKLTERVVTYEPAPTLASASFALFYRVATGSDSLTITNGGQPVESQFVSYRIQGGNAPICNTSEIRSGNLRPPSLSPGLGSRDYLWLAFGALGFPEESGRSINAAPPGFSNLLVASQLDGGGSSFRYSLAAAEMHLSASSLNATLERTFSFTSASQTVLGDAIGGTVAIPPASSSGFFF